MEGFNFAMLFAVLFGISEALAVIPSIKSSGVFQLIYNVLKSLAPKKPE